MKLSSDDKKIQADIASRLKTGLPLAGLLTMLTVGCEKLPIAEPQVMGKYLTTENQEVSQSVSNDGETKAPPAENQPTMPKPLPPKTDKNGDEIKTPPPLAGVPLPPKTDKNGDEMTQNTKTPPRRLAGMPLPPKSDTDKQNEKATEKK